MDGLELRDVAYRLFRLRRLFVFAVLVPLPSLLFADLLGRGLTYSGVGGMLFGLWILAVAAYIIRYPNGWMDLLAIAASLATVIFLSPFAALIGIGPILGTPLAALVAFVLWLYFNNQPARLDQIRLGTCSSTFRGRAPMPPEALREAVFLRPEAEIGLHVCGPADDQGIFEVRALGYHMLDTGFEPVPSEITFWARVIEAEDTRQVMQIFETALTHSSSAVLQTLTPKGRGTLYEVEEIHDHFTVLSALGFWLNDVAADHFTATLDHVQGLPPRALKLMPQDSLLTRTAQYFVKQRLA